MIRAVLLGATGLAISGKIFSLNPIGKQTSTSKSNGIHDTSNASHKGVTPPPNLKTISHCPHILHSTLAATLLTFLFYQSHPITDLTKFFSAALIGAILAHYGAAWSFSRHLRNISNHHHHHHHSLTHHPQHKLQGYWSKDKVASDSMDQACNAMKLGGIIRAAIGLIKGIEIKGFEEGVFQLDVLSGILWFRVKEVYPLDDTVVKHRRRDMRKGGALGRARVLFSDGGGSIWLRNEFDGGSLEEKFHLSGVNELHVDAVLRIGDGSPVKYKQVYRRERGRG